MFVSVEKNDLAKSELGEIQFKDDAMKAGSLPDIDEFDGYDLKDEKALRQCAKKLHQNLGNKVWKDLRHHLLKAEIPRKLYNGMRGFCNEDEKINFRQARPLSRPARFPMIDAPFELLQLDFMEFEEQKILHIQDCFSRFSVLKYMGKKTKKGKSK